MSIPDNFEKAFFVVRENDTGPLRRGAKPSDAISVHFNPTSLQHVVSNTMKETGRGSSAKQYVSQSTAKLTMDLIFDTTDSGQDVRALTSKVAQFMKPTRAVSSNNQDRKVPPVVLFAWGNFMFQGMVESFSGNDRLFLGQRRSAARQCERDHVANRTVSLTIRTPLPQLSRTRRFSRTRSKCPPPRIRTPPRPRRREEIQVPAAVLPPLTIWTA